MARSVRRLAWLVLISTVPVWVHAQKLVIESSRELPASVARSFDIRWANGEAIHLALGRNGVVECKLNDLGHCALLVGPIGGRAVAFDEPTPVPGFFFSSRLAESENYVVAASPFRGFAYRPRNGKELTQAGFDTIVDIDVHGSTVAILGGRRDDAGTWAPEGAIVWMGSLESRLRDLKPVTYSAAGGGARPMALCSILDHGAVRFLDNGNLFVVPGVEPGAFLYDRTGRLIRTWPTEHLNFMDDCTISQSLSNTLAKDFSVRSDWLNRYRVIDDGIDMDGGPGIVVRSSSTTGTRWSVVQFLYNGKTRELPLPLSSPSAHAHLNVDRRGSRLVFLIRDSEIRGRPVLGGRVVVASVKP